MITYALALLEVHKGWQVPRPLGWVSGFLDAALEVLGVVYCWRSINA
jgi:hypothetical protein